MPWDTGVSSEEVQRSHVSAKLIPIPDEIKGQLTYDLY